MVTYISNYNNTLGGKINKLIKNAQYFCDEFHWDHA